MRQNLVNLNSVDDGGGDIRLFRYISIMSTSDTYKS